MDFVHVWHDRYESEIYVKILKIGTPEMFNCPRKLNNLFLRAVMCLKDVDEIANTVDPD